MSKWIKFDEIPNPKGKTKRWAIRTLDGETIGAVYWHSPWRKYIFHPLPGTIWEQDCLRDVASFLIEETVAHKTANLKSV